MENRLKPSESAPKFFTTFNAAKLLGVDMTTVIDWCRQGKLQAFKTPGGHRRISPADLLKFLQMYKMPVPSSLQSLLRFQCLVVEDDPMSRRLVARVISAMDVQAKVELAEDGFEAGKKLIEMMPHLVIVDLMLPGINGFKVCEEIRKDPRLKETKILAISANEDPATRKTILSAGANDFLQKPFTAEDLSVRLKTLLGRP